MLYAVHRSQHPKVFSVAVKHHSISLMGILSNITSFVQSDFKYPREFTLLGDASFLREMFRLVPPTK